MKMCKGKAVNNSNARKPRHLFYGLLLIAFIAITGSTFFISEDSACATALISVVAGIGGGGVASIIVAWLIDILTCRSERIKASRMGEMVFFELHYLLRNVIEDFPAAFCDYVPKDDKKRTWKEWLEFVIQDGQIIVNKNWRISLLDSVVKAQVEISNIQKQSLLIVAQGLMTESEIDGLEDIRIALNVFESNLTADFVDGDFLKYFSIHFGNHIQLIHLLSDLNTIKFENKARKVAELMEQNKGEEVGEEP